MLKRTTSAALLATLGLLAAACPASLDDQCADNACVGGSVGEGGVDGDGGGGDAPVDPCLDKPTEPRCLDETKAIFVSGAVGNDETGGGTKVAPFKTLKAALAKLTAERRRVYVCTGDYAEDVELTAAHSGVSIFGGLTCTWDAPGPPPKIGATQSPLRVTATTGLAIADVSFEAKDAQSGSSIAAFFNGGDATLKRVRLAAGKGGIGAAGTLTAFNNFPSQADLNGNPAPDGVTGGPAKAVMCPGGLETIGGKGGDPAKSGMKGAPGTADNGGKLSTCAQDLTGASAPPTDPAQGATAVGRITESGWLPEPGADGMPGSPGQGGGGGYGNDGAGGGGGAGGCGGAGGGGGKGGGASIALASHLATITLVEVELVASQAGGGGPGALGQDAQAEFGARGTGSGFACNGGNGGRGAKGGAGGGGAGGSSFAIAYKGTAPTLDAATTSKIRLGQKGEGGQLPGTNAGIAGEARNIYQSD